MDLGTIGYTLVTEGEAEARAAIERYVRAADAAVEAMDADAQRAERASQAKERAIQREIRNTEAMLREANSLKRAYETLASSFDPVNKAQLEYARNIELLEKAMDANIISIQQYNRVMGELEKRFANTVNKERVRSLEAEQRAMRETERAAQDARRSYEQLLAAVDPLYAANLKYSNSVEKLNDAYAKGAITVGEYNKMIGILQSQLTRDMNAPKVAAMEREREEARKLADQHERLASEYAQLSARVNPAVRAHQEHQNAIRVLDAALAENIITQRQYAQTLSDVEARIRAMGHIVNDSGVQMSRADTQWRRFARGAVQNAGYQVADFAVQVSMGTSAFVAFGQQAPQFLGHFGAIGSILGAVVAVGAAVGNIFYQLGKNAGAADKTIQELEKTFGQVEESLKRLRDIAEDGEIFGSMTPEIASLTNALLQLDKAASLRNLFTALEKMRKENIEPSFWQKASGAIAVGLAGGQVGGGFDLATSESLLSGDAFRQANFEELGLRGGYEYFMWMIEGIERAAQGGDLEEVTRLIDELVRTSMPDLNAVGEAAKSGGLDLLRTYAQVAIETATLVGNLNGSTEEARRLREETEALESTFARARESQAEAREESAARRRLEQIEIADAYRTMRETKDDAFWVRYYAKLDEMEKALSGKRESRDEAYYANLERLEDELQGKRESRDAAQGAAQERFFEAASRAHDEYRQAREAAEELAEQTGQAYLSALGIGQTDMASGVKAAAAAAAILARDLGISAQAARDMMLMAISTQNKRDSMTYSGRGGDPRDFMDGGSKSFSSGARPFVPDPKKKSGGGEKQDPMEKLREQVKLEYELLYVSEAQKRVLQALGEDRAKYSEKEIEFIIREIEMLNKKKEAIQQQQEIADTLREALSEGFMAMVEGTKTVEDAFKDMARAVIKQLYDILVVQRIVGSWSASTGTGSGLVGAIMGAFQASGGAWQGGRQVEAFANGGIVSGPTLFGMSGGRAGLMGEAGPEAILPLRRGSDGKLGVAAQGGGGLTVQNNVTVSGGDENMVRAAVIKMLPKITEATKMGVMEARARGGKMMTTFG